jgi:hypothetical protein
MWHCSVTGVKPDVVLESSRKYLRFVKDFATAEGATGGERLYISGHTDEKNRARGSGFSRFF